MDAVINFEWRAYPAAALFVLGMVLTVRALRQCRAAWPSLSASMQPLAWMRGFRLAIVGLAVAGVGAAWQWQIGWLLALSLAIAFEEVLETSICIAALRRAPAQERRTTIGA